MGDLFEDTGVHGDEGGYTALVRDDWAAFGPNGGYLAAIALRAAGALSNFARPVSFGCHYLGPAEFSTVRLVVQRVFGSRRAESLRVSMTQRQRPILEATVWTVGEIAADFEDYDAIPMPGGPPAETLMEGEWLADARAPSPPLKLWQNFDQRLIGWQGWQGPGEPRIDGWYRFRPRPVMPDAFADAARSLIIIDVATWLAATNRHVGRAQIMAPTMELAVRFYHECCTEWLRCQARSDMALGGLIDGAAAVWSSDGKLVARGECRMLYQTMTRLAPDGLP